MKCVQETKLFQKTSLSYFTALRNNFMNNIEHCLIVEQIVHWSEYILNIILEILLWGIFLLGGWYLRRSDFEHSNLSQS